MGISTFKVEYQIVPAELKAQSYMHQILRYEIKESQE